MSLLLLKQAQVYSPQFLGTQDVLISGKSIIALAPNIEMNTNIGINIVDCSGKLLCPGFVDSLTHITGGGGEGGFASRTPEMKLTDAIKGGVTTVTGALGTDAVCRTHAELVAKVKALKEEGISAYFYTGNYHYPVKTLTGSVQQDIMLIDECIGIGEIAIADHRGSQLSWQQMASVAADARVGGMCSGKAGIVMVHTGDGADKLKLLFDVAEHTDIPLSQFYPTHINRNSELLSEGLRFNKAGGTIDFTASTTEQFIAAGEVPCAAAFKHCIENGADVDRITFSTDGHASLPHFDNDGRLQSMQIGQMTSLLDAVTVAVQKLGLSLDIALLPVTQNPATILRLKRKGRISVGFDADILLLDAQTLKLTDVLANGQWLKQHNKIIRKGTFEN